MIFGRNARSHRVRVVPRRESSWVALRWSPFHVSPLPGGPRSLEKARLPAAGTGRPHEGNALALRTFLGSSGAKLRGEVRFLVPPPSRKGEAKGGGEASGAANRADSSRDSETGTLPWLGVEESGCLERRCAAFRLERSGLAARDRGRRSPLALPPRAQSERLGVRDLSRSPHF